MKFRGVFEHPVVLPLALAFLLLNLAVTEFGGTNAKSRNAALRAMSESQTFSITRYQDWTIDWAQTPDGNYYSNKAPGPMLLGFPLYWTMDQVTKLTEHGWRDSLGRRKESGYIFHIIFIFSLQVIPYILLVGLGAAFLANAGASPAAVTLALLAVFFGNTAVTFMNSNFGHGFAAVLVLALALALQSRKYFLVGLLTGFAVLSDYGVIVQLPAIFLALGILLWSSSWRQRLGALGACALGAIPGAVLWIWYHTLCFGSMFALPNKFQNPNFQDMKDLNINLWGVIGLPNPSILYELILGPARGILYTQPYVLLLPVLLFAWFVKQWRRGIEYSLCVEEFSFWIFSFLGLLGLLAMNAGFGGWHGGMSPGPRYLSAIFPCIGLLIGLLYDRLGAVGRGLLWSSVVAAIVLRGLVYAHGILVPNEPIWSTLLGDLQDPQHFKTGLLREAIFAVIILAAVFWSWRRSKQFYALLAQKSTPAN